MAEQPPNIMFEDVPLDKARRMGRGPRMELMLYDTLRHKLQSLSTEATRIHLGPEITPQRMKSYILHICLNIKVRMDHTQRTCGRAGLLCGRHHPRLAP
jgi:hypothetical protein